MRQRRDFETKVRVSDLLQDAQKSVPQEIAVISAPTAVILPAKDGGSQSAAKLSLVDFLRASPLAGVDLDIERDTSPMRNVHI